MQLHTYHEFEIWNLEQNVCSLSSHLLNNKNYSFKTSHLTHIFLHTVDLRKIQVSLFNMRSGLITNKRVTKMFVINSP